MQKTPPTGQQIADAFSVVLIKLQTSRRTPEQESQLAVIGMTLSWVLGAHLNEADDEHTALMDEYAEMGKRLRNAVAERN